MQITKPELPKGIKRVLAKGNTYYYHRKTNTRINAMLGTQAFMDALAELEEGIVRAKINLAAGLSMAEAEAVAPAKRGTRGPALGFEAVHPLERRRNSIWMVLLNSYERSTECEAIGPSWKRDINTWANHAADRWPDMTAEEAADDALYALVNAWRTEVHRTGKSATADRIAAVLRVLTKHGRNARLLTRNALMETFTPLRTIGGRVELVFKMEWLTAAALKRLGDQDLTDAMELALWTGARRGDLCAMRWDMIDAEGWLTFAQSKTKKEISRYVSLPTFALPPLAALLKRIKARQKALGYTGPNILTSTDPTGHKGTCAMSGTNLNKRWQECKNEKVNKHLAGLHLHDLRGTLTCLMDEAECSDKEIAAVTGHAVKIEVPSLTKYRKISKQNALVAYKKLAAYLAK